jgi:tRNA pseudouridine(55) synthase
MLNIYKKSGETMEQLIQRIKKEHNLKKLCYTARLDPMAKGIVPILTNDLCLKINDYFNTNKNYQVKIIFGIQTDTDDPLGIITKIENVDIEIFNNNYKSVIDYLNLINNTSFLQKYHYYSTKMLNHRKQKSTNIVDSHTVSLNNYEIIKTGIYDYKLWNKKIIDKINSIDISKNFRQNDIITQWNNLILHQLYYIKINLNVSSGFFVRQLIRDISDNVKFPLLCYNINRTIIC